MALQAAAYLEDRLAKELKEATHKPRINKTTANVQREPVHSTPWAANWRMKPHFNRDGMLSQLKRVGYPWALELRFNIDGS